MDNQEIEQKIATLESKIGEMDKKFYKQYLMNFGLLILIGLSVYGLLALIGLSFDSS
jgi:hypothetical protein